jgi:phosphate transport system protein
MTDTPAHVNVLLQREIDSLKGRTVLLCALVERSLREAITAFRELDPSRAAEVIDGDDRIDQAEVEVEEECLKILALHQPVATDLRLIVAIIKLNNDLERIGDLAVDIAERAVHLADLDPLPVPRQIHVLADKVQAMLRQALDAFVNLDAPAARAVCAADDEVDRLHRQMFDHVEALMAATPSRTRDFINVLSVSRYLERIADHATNIAEDVVYTVDGVIVRHRGENT